MLLKKTSPRDVATQAAQDPELGVHRALYSITDTRKKVGGIGVTKVYELIAEEELIAVKMGARTFVTADSIDAFIARLPRADIATGQNRNSSKNADLPGGAASRLGVTGGVYNPAAPARGAYGQAGQAGVRAGPTANAGVQRTSATADPPT